MNNLICRFESIYASSYMIYWLIWSDIFIQIIKFAILLINQIKKSQERMFYLTNKIPNPRGAFKAN